MKTFRQSRKYQNNMMARYTSRVKPVAKHALTAMAERYIRASSVLFYIFGVKAFSFLNMNVARDAPRSISTIGGRFEGQRWPMMASTAVSRELLSRTRDWCRKSDEMNLSACVLVALSVFFFNPVTALADGLPGSSSGCSTTATNPSYTVVSCERTGLDRDGRLLGCSSSENCVSTSAVNIPGKLGSPWEYALQTDDADRAFASLVQAVEASSDATMKMIDTKGLYLLAQFPSKVPPGSVDSVEFLVKPADRIVLYRSVSRDTLFIYPLQRPVSDQGKIKERLEGIRKELGWSMYTYRGE